MIPITPLIKLFSCQNCASF